MSDPFTEAPPDSTPAAPVLTNPGAAPATEASAAKRVPLLEGLEAPVAAATAKPIVTGAPKPRTAPPRAVSAGPRWGHFIVFSLFQIGLLGAGAVYLLRQQATPPEPVVTTAVPTVAEADTRAFENALKTAQKEIETLQAQLDAQSEEKQRTQARLQEMADRMALVLQQSSLTGVGATARGGADSTAAEVASMLPSVTPATAELILIKERNRLTEYADRAIAEGSRVDLESLVKAMMDPDLRDLAHAARAEFKRVQAWYEIGISIDPGYTLPVQEWFPQEGFTREADLAPAHLHALLLDLKRPWEARLRAAFLLRSSNDPETTRLLLQVLKEDPMLDVAKQAQTTFENRVGRKFRIFDIPAIDAWWQAQGQGGKAGE